MSYLQKFLCARRFIIHYSEDLQVKTARGVVAVSLWANPHTDLFVYCCGQQAHSKTLISPHESSPLYHSTTMIQSDMLVMYSL